MDSLSSNQTISISSDSSSPLLRQDSSAMDTSGSLSRTSSAMDTTPIDLNAPLSRAMSIVETESVSEPIKSNSDLTAHVTASSSNDTSDIAPTEDVIEETADIIGEEESIEPEEEESIAPEEDDSDESEAIILPGAQRKKYGQNYAFYSGNIRSAPSGGLIDDIHRKWYWNFDLLESHHGYIQWLFPVFENGGLNHHARSLGKEEAKLMREDFSIACRVIWSYKLMLNFYGLRLVDFETGKIEKQEEYWQSRFLNLRQQSHNYLRINRIITSLGHLGFERYRKPLITFFQKEVNAPDSLISTCKYSLKHYWEMALKPNSKEFVSKTLETKEDRTDSIFFKDMAENSQKYLEFLKEITIWEETSSEARLRAIEADMKIWRKWENKMKASRANPIVTRSRRKQM